MHLLVHRAMKAAEGVVWKQIADRRAVGVGTEDGDDKECIEH